MTELDLLIERHIKKRLQNEYLNEEDIEKITLSFRAGFFACRAAVLSELKYLGTYAMARDIKLGTFIEVRYLKIAAIGELDADIYI